MELKAQSKWRWGVAVYLFLVGIGAGGYVVGVLADFRGPEWTTLAKIGVFLGFPCCSIAGLVKLRQLGNPAAAWRAWMRPGTSWIARGSLLLFAFIGVSFLHLVLWVWPAPNVLAEAEGARHFIGILGALIGVGMMLYTGILLTAARPIAFWSTSLLPLLFMLASLLSGMMAIVLIATIGGVPFAGPIATMMQAVIAFLVLEGIAVAMFLQSSHRVMESRASVAMVLKGRLALQFWLGIAVCGVILPLLFSALALAAGSGFLAALAAVLSLAGGLLIRQMVLAGGIHSPLRAGAFEVALPIV